MRDWHSSIRYCQASVTLPSPLIFMKRFWGASHHLACFPASACIITTVPDLSWLERQKAEDQMLDLSCLPASLSAWKTTDFNLDTQSFQSVKFVGLTRLCYYGTAMICTEVHELLQRLPQIQASLRSHFSWLLHTTVNIDSQATSQVLSSNSYAGCGCGLL